MKSTERKSIRFRIILVAVFFGFFFAAIGIKAICLQVFQGAWLSQKAAGEYEKSIITQGERGTIYDRKYREMAVSVNVTSIAAYPGKIKDVHETAQLLAKALSLSSRSLRQSIDTDKSFVWIKRHATPKEVESVKKLDLTGIDFIPEHSRFYPGKMLAAQVLGFSGIDGRGLEGIEFFCDRHLQGSSENFRVLTDALGRGFEADQQLIPNNRGNDVILTIDWTIQYITENALEKAVREFGAKSGMAVVMSPQNGAVLAMAHYPFFNPNAFSAFDQELWRNRAITDPFEPGSTMKIFLAAAALEKGKSSPNAIFFCENGAYRIGRNVVHDTHPHGWLSLQQIVKYSSNIGAVKVAETIGSKVLYHTLKDFGFGAKTGIDCPGETAGSLAPYRRWTKIDTGAISFGQGIAVSAIQLATAVSAIGNNGILMKPYMVQGIMDRNGGLIERFGPQEVRRCISEKNARTIRRIMATVTTEGGTGVNASLDGYKVCGKTGTAQKTDEKGTYAKGRYVASFVGLVPSEDPELTILVLIDEPKDHHYGGTVAAPAFRQIAHETLNYLNIPPKGAGTKDRNRLTVSKGCEARG
jgi:cell division protein FtsI (penicillin-binding protein 3)